MDLREDAQIRNSSAAPGMNTPTATAPGCTLEGETKLNYTGTKPPYEHLNVEEKYSYLKTPTLEEATLGSKVRW